MPAYSFRCSRAPRRPSGHPLGTGGGGAEAQRSPARSRARFELGLRSSKGFARDPFSFGSTCHACRGVASLPSPSGFCSWACVPFLRPLLHTRPAWNGHQQRSDPRLRPESRNLSRVGLQLKGEGVTVPVGCCPGPGLPERGDLGEGGRGEHEDSGPPQPPSKLSPCLCC